MERLMSAPLVTLRQVNETVRSALVRFRPEVQLCSAIAPGEFSSLLGELLRARECLSGFVQPDHSISPEIPEDQGALAQEVREYRANLEELKRILPGLQARLLVERSRLQKAQMHAAAAAAWAGASKKTLQK
jgi:hypothetical protein